MAVETLPAGYAMRPPSNADAEAVAALWAACELADAGATETTISDLLSEWQRLDLTECAEVVTAPDGRIVGYADVLNRSYVSMSVYGYVHPDERGRGIGRTLVEWGETWARDRIDRAPADARVIVQHYIRGSNQPARQLLEASGYAPVRGVYTMAIDMDEPPPSPVWPEGLRVRSFIPGQDEQATYEAVEDAFRDVWGRPKSTFERFVAYTRERESDPDLFFLAMDGPRIAGVCLSRIVGDRGVINTLAVRRPWRRHGLGLALLRHAFDALYRRGIRHVWLSVDAESITGAPKLYARAGMHVTESYIIHQKELRSGKDLGMRS